MRSTARVPYTCYGQLKSRLINVKHFTASQEGPAQWRPYSPGSADRPAAQWELLCWKCYQGVCTRQFGAKKLSWGAKPSKLLSSHELGRSAAPPAPAGAGRWSRFGRVRCSKGGRIFNQRMGERRGVGPSCRAVVATSPARKPRTLRAASTLSFGRLAAVAGVRRPPRSAGARSRPHRTAGARSGRWIAALARSRPRSRRRFRCDRPSSA